MSAYFISWVQNPLKCTIQWFICSTSNDDLQKKNPKASQYHFQKLYSSVELQIRGFFHAREIILMKNVLLWSQVSKSITLQACEALWCNCKQPQSSESRTATTTLAKILLIYMNCIQCKHITSGIKTRWLYLIHCIYFSPEQFGIECPKCIDQAGMALKIKWTCCVRPDSKIISVCIFHYAGGIMMTGWAISFVRRFEEKSTIISYSPNVHK